MAADGRERDLDLERRERESFIVLQYVYTLTDASADVSVPCARIAADLGYRESGCGELIEHLVYVGHLAWVRPGLTISITPGGIEYIQQLAWRRRSVRLPPE
jgi:hypothetical protein